MILRDLDPADYGYALSSFRETHHDAPGIKHYPWRYYKREYGDRFAKLIDDESNIRLGAYESGGPLLGWLVATPGKRVDTLHWIHVKHGAGRRQGVASALLVAADLGKSFVYTLKSKKVDGKPLDETLVEALRRRGITASHVPLLEWLA